MRKATRVLRPKLPTGVLHDRDRHGNVRIYLRGSPKVRLREAPGTPEFEKEVERARMIQRGLIPPDAPSTKPPIEPPTRAVVGSLDWLVDEYERRGRGTVTDNEFARRLRELRKACDYQPREVRTGDLPYKKVDPRIVGIVRDGVKATTGARDNLLRILSALYHWAEGVGLMPPKSNPCHGVRPVHKKVGFHTWTEEEVAQYEARHPIGTMARLALALAMFTGLRRQELAIIGPKHRAGGRIRITPGKTSRSSSVEVDIPLLDCLAEVIAATPGTGAAFLLSERGRPFKSPACLGNAMQRWTEQAGLPHCSLHGLRKAGATRAAENGATPHQMMSIFGWTTLAQAEAYTRKAQRRKMATDGIHALVMRASVEAAVTADSR
jgi:integrase